MPHKRLVGSIVGLLAMVGCSPAPPSGLIQPGDDLPLVAAEGWLNGGPVTPSDLSGKVVVVDVWAYW